MRSVRLPTVQSRKKNFAQKWPIRIFGRVIGLFPFRNLSPFLDVYDVTYIKLQFFRSFNSRGNYYEPLSNTLF